MRLTAEELAQPVSDDLPCGDDLEYDPAFQQMETMMESSAEQEFGDTVIEATGPDWKGVSLQVDDLITRTRDLRVLTYGAIADLHLKGLPEFSKSLEALNTCMETFWDTIYPELDVDDNNDATMRFNTLQMLNDYQLVNVGLERAPLVELKGIGRFSLHDIWLAEGKVSPVGDEVAHDIALIKGAFGDADGDDLVALGEGISGSISELNRAVELWGQLAEGGDYLAVDETIKVLNEVHQAITTYAPVAAAAASDGEVEFEGEGATGSAPAQSISGSINSREDVSRAIDKICDYYAANEPSSPIPIFLRRAQRLVKKSFVEILKDMIPNSIDDMEVIGGESYADEDDY
jgi:type VI secretion system protein ImpA